MKILVLDTIHGGAVLAEALLRHGDEVVAVDVYRGGVPSVSEVESEGYDFITAPVHLDPDFPLLKTKIPVISHHEMTGILAKDYQIPLIEITGAEGKTTTAFAIAAMMPGKGILHTSAGTFLCPEMELLFRKSITPASLLFALDAAKKKGASWVVAEESIGVSGAGILGVLTSEKDYAIGAGKKSAFCSKEESLQRCKQTLTPSDVSKIVSVDGDKIISPAGVFKNQLTEIPVYQTALKIAAAAATILGVAAEPLEHFKAVAGRMALEVVDGITVLDNANSGTTAKNTLAAAEYLRRVSNKPIVLVIGEGGHAVCEGFKDRETVASFDFARVINADGEPFEELKAKGVAAAKECNAALLLAVKMWR